MGTLDRQFVTSEGHGVGALIVSSFYGGPRPPFYLSVRFITDFIANSSLCEDPITSYANTLVWCGVIADECTLAPESVARSEVEIFRWRYATI